MGSTWRTSKNAVLGSIPRETYYLVWVKVSDIDDKKAPQGFIIGRVERLALCVFNPHACLHTKTLAA